MPSASQEGYLSGRRKIETQTPAQIQIRSNRTPSNESSRRHQVQSNAVACHESCVVGIDINSEHDADPWLCEYAVWAWNRFAVKALGVSCLADCYGYRYHNQVVPFLECVINRVPKSHARRARGRTVQKADALSVRGICVGKSEDSDEHLLLAPEW